MSREAEQARPGMGDGLPVQEKSQVFKKDFLTDGFRGYENHWPGQRDKQPAEEIGPGGGVETRERDLSGSRCQGCRNLLVPGSQGKSFVHVMKIIVKIHRNSKGPLALSNPRLVGSLFPPDLGKFFRRLTSTNMSIIIILNYINLLLNGISFAVL
jgi:hypothetical protein